MKCVWLDRGFVRLVQEQSVLGAPIFSVELEGEGTLYSHTTLYWHTSYEAAEHYFQMLTQPMEKTAA